jgi:uncharacterized integral membrane protein
MSLKLLAFLILLMAIVIFCVENASQVRLRFLGWEFSSSQALVILVCAFAGVAIGLGMSAFSRRRRE